MRSTESTDRRQGRQLEAPAGGAEGSRWTSGLVDGSRRRGTDDAARKGDADPSALRPPRTPHSVNRVPTSLRPECAALAVSLFSLYKRTIRQGSSPTARARMRVLVKCILRR